MATQKDPTTFYTLPRELRDMVYTLLLPADRIINFPVESVQTRDALASFALTSHNREVEDFVYANCGVHITITPDQDQALPKDLDWYRFQRMKITINPPTRLARRSRLAGVTELTNQLQTGPLRSLPNLTIELCAQRNDFRLYDTVPNNSFVTFKEGDGPFNSVTNDGRISGRYIWSRKRQVTRHTPNNVSGGGHDMCLQSEHRWLRTHDDGYPIGACDSYTPKATDPVLTTILNKFIILPACRSASVRAVHGLDLDQRCPWLPRYDPRRRVFDRTYMEDMCSALERWLSGRRDGVRFGSNKYGLSKLERLAYLEVNGRYYCDMDSA